MLKKAIKLAEKAHTGQSDKAGKPYILHPYYVAIQMESELEKIAALLHDVVEDSDITLENLKEYGFNDVVDIIDNLTKRKGEDYLEYLDRVKAHPVSKKVKLADLNHNMDLSRIPNPTEKDRNRVQKYLKAVEYLNKID